MVFFQAETCEFLVYSMCNCIQGGSIAKVGHSVLMIQYKQKFEPFSGKHLSADCFDCLMDLFFPSDNVTGTGEKW